MTTMSDLLLNEQGSFRNNLCANAVVTDYPSILPSSSALDCIIHPPPETSYPSCQIPHQNQNFSGLCGTDADWATNPFACPSMSSEFDARSFDTSFSYQFPHDCAVPFWKQLAPRCPTIDDEATLVGTVGTFFPHLFQDVTKIPERRTAHIATVHSQAQSHPKRASAAHSSARSTLPRSARHTPYTRHCTSPVSLYECRWTENGGTTPCSALVRGVKHAIAKHLHDAHAIRCRADEPMQACLWDACGKSMRRESIARHVLAVHMQHKVPCPMCGTRFARADSLQRHLRTQCLVDGEAVDLDKAEK